MLRLESYLAPVLSGLLNKYIKNLKADGLQLSLWSGEATFNQLELRLDNIENEFDLPLELNSGLVHELKIRIPWTRLGSEPVNIAIDGLDLRCRMRKPQPPNTYAQSASYKDQFNGDADRRTSKCSSSTFADHTTDDGDSLNPSFTDRGRHAVSNQDPGYLATLIRKAKLNCRITVKNVNVQYYISSEVVLNVFINELDICPTDAAWQPTYLSLPAARNEFALRRQINVKNFTISVNGRRYIKSESDKQTNVGATDVNSELVKTCSFTCRSETVYSDFVTRAIKSVRFHSYFDLVELVVVTDHLPHLVRLYEYVVAYISGYVPTAREIRRQAHKLPLNVAASNTFNVSTLSPADDSGWTGWAKSWIGYNNSGEADDSKRSPAAPNDAGVQEVIDFLDDDDADDVTAKADEVEYALFCRQGSITFATLQSVEIVAAGAGETESVDILTVHTGAHRPQAVLPFLKLEGRGICTRIRVTAANRCVNIAGNVMQATGYNVNFYGYSFPEPIFRMCNNNNLQVPDSATFFASSLSSLTKDSLFDLDRSPQQHAETDDDKLPKTVAEHINLYSEQVILSRNHALSWDFVKFKCHEDENDESSFRMLPSVAEQRMRRQNVILRIFTAPMQLLIDDCFAQRSNLITECIYDTSVYKRPLITPDEELLFDTLPLHLAEEELNHILNYKNDVPSRTFSLVVPGVEAIVIGLRGSAKLQKNAAEGTISPSNMPTAWIPFLCDDVALQQQQGAAAIVLRSPRFEWELNAPLDHEQLYETFLTLLSDSANNTRLDALTNLLFQTQTIRMFCCSAFATIFTASNCLTTMPTSSGVDNNNNNSNIWYALQNAYACLMSAPAKLLTIQPAEFEYRFTCAPFARAFPLHDVAARRNEMNVNNINVIGSGADLLLAWNCLCITFWPDMYVDEPNITEHVRHSVVDGYAVNNIITNSGAVVHRMALRMPSLNISFSAYKSGNFRQHHQFQLEEVALLPRGTADRFCVLKPIFSGGESECPTTSHSLSYFTQDVVLDVDQQLRTLAGGRRASVEVRKLREKYGRKHSVLHLANSLQVNLAAEHVNALLDFVVLSRVLDIYGAVVGEDVDTENVAAEAEKNDAAGFADKPSRNFEFDHPAVRFFYSVNGGETKRNILEVALSPARFTTSNYSAAYYVMQYENFSLACFLSKNTTSSLSMPVLTLIDGNVTVERHYATRRTKTDAEMPEKWIVIGRTDSIRVSLMPSTLKAAILLAGHAANDAEMFRKTFLSPKSEAFTTEMPMKAENDTESNREPDSQVISYDDLRALTWKYVFYSSSTNPSNSTAPPLPKRGEIVFDEGRSGDSQNIIKSMTWRYGEARSITTLRALPVPLCSDAADSADKTENNMPFRIVCTLSYYDELNGMFKKFKTFCLSETQEFLLNDSDLLLPISSKRGSSRTKRGSSAAKFRNSSGQNSTNSSVECIPVAETWRIDIQLAMQDSQQQHDFAVFSVAALGACLIIDSCINYSAAPRMQVKLSCRRTEISLSYCAADFGTHQKMSDGDLYVKPAALNVPVEMLRFSVDDAELIARLYTTAQSRTNASSSPHLIVLDVSAWTQASVTELASLTRLPFLDPICVHMTGTVVRASSGTVGKAEEDIKFAGFSYAKLNVSLSAGASGATCATLHVNPNILHSLLRAVRVWKLADSSLARHVDVIPQRSATLLGAHTLLCNNISAVMLESFDRSSEADVSPVVYYHQQRISTSIDIKDVHRLEGKQIVPIYLRLRNQMTSERDVSRLDRCRFAICVVSDEKYADCTVDQFRHWINLDLPASLSIHKTSGKQGWSKSLTMKTNTNDLRVALHCLQLNNIQQLYMLTGSVMIFNDTHLPMTATCAAAPPDTNEIVSAFNIEAFAYKSCAVPTLVLELTVQFDFSTFLQAEKSYYASEAVKISLENGTAAERRSHCMSKLLRLSVGAASKTDFEADLFVLLNLMVRPDGIVVLHLTPPMFVKTNTAITWPVYLQPLDAVINSLTLSSHPPPNVEQYALIDSFDAGKNDNLMMAIYNLDLEKCSKLSVKLNNLYARPTTCVDIGRVVVADERQIKYEILKDCPLLLIQQHLNETPSERRERIGSKALFLQLPESPSSSSHFPLLHQRSSAVMPPPPDVVPISMHNTAQISTQNPCSDVTARVITHAALPGCKVLELVPHGLIVRNDMHANFEINLISSSSHSSSSNAAPITVRGQSTSFMPVSAAVFGNSNDDEIGRTAANPLDCPVRLRIVSANNSGDGNEHGEITFRIYASKQTKKLQDSKSEAVSLMPANLDDAVDCTEYGALPRGGVLRETLASTVISASAVSEQLGFVRFLLIYLYTEPNGLYVLHIQNAYPVNIPNSTTKTPLYKLFAWSVGDASAMPSLGDIIKYIPAWNSSSYALKEAWPVLLNSHTANPVADNMWRRVRYVPAVLPVGLPNDNEQKISYCASILDTSTYKRLAPHRAAVADNDDDEARNMLQFYSHVVIPGKAASVGHHGADVMPDAVHVDEIYYGSRIKVTVNSRGLANNVEIVDKNSSFLTNASETRTASKNDTGLLFVIDNCCQHEIAVGESLVRRAAVLNEKAQTMEDELFYRMPPVVPSGGRLYYMPPSLALISSTSDTAENNVTLRFGRLLSVRDPKRPTCVWSDDEITLGPSILEKNNKNPRAVPMECFIAVSGICSLKLTCERSSLFDGSDSNIYRIRIDPAGKVNFNSWRRVVSPPTPNVLATEKPEDAPVISLKREQRSEPQQFVATVKVQCVCVCIEDTLLAPGAVVEIIRLTLDRFQVQAYAVASLSAVELAVTLHSAQLDNQLALLPPALQQDLLHFTTNGYFDFPVVLVKGDTNEAGGKDTGLLRGGGRPLKNSQPMLNFVLNIARKQTTSLNLNIELRKLFVSISPCSVFLEDRFVYTLLQLSDHFIVPDLLSLFVNAANVPTTKNDTVANATDQHFRSTEGRKGSSSTVIAVDKLFVSPIFINLSLHASLSGLFIAVNSSPLFFEELELGGGIKCTLQELAAMMFMHYANVTLLKAGMVLGSADLLGNPVNLLRSFGRGIHDAFLLPCLSSNNSKQMLGSGMTSLNRSFSGVEGRLSFAEALTQGTRSLLSNISMGSLTSLTRWFESLSRNLDNLVYDPDYMRRRMELTASNANALAAGGQISESAVMYENGLSSQHSNGKAALMTTPPSVVAPMLVGLQHGLAGFGFSLLGALAGVIDQPMRAASKAYKKGRIITSSNNSTTSENLFVIDIDDCDDDEDSGSDSSKSGSVLRALLTGLGRGLLGMLTKPLAGATSLVAQTGAGLLQGMSEACAPTPRFHNYVVPISEFWSSSSSHNIPLSLTSLDCNNYSDIPLACLPVISSTVSDNVDSTNRLLMLTRNFIMEMTMEGLVIRVVNFVNLTSCCVRTAASSASSLTTSAVATDAVFEIVAKADTAENPGNSAVFFSKHLYAVQQANVADAQVFCSSVRLLQILMLV